MAFQYATQKQQDKSLDKAAQVAQKWLQRGFTPQQVAEGITNKIGYQTFVSNGKVNIYGCYNKEYQKIMFYVMRRITADSIEKFTAEDGIRD